RPTPSAPRNAKAGPNCDLPSLPSAPLLRAGARPPHVFQPPGTRDKLPHQHGSAGFPIKTEMNRQVRQAARFESIYERALAVELIEGKRSQGAGAFLFDLAPRSGGLADLAIHDLNSIEV